MSLSVIEYCAAKIKVNSSLGRLAHELLGS